jgi:hypothetical protein
LVGVTHGTNHVLIIGKPWVKLARRFLSQRSRHKLGLRVYERSTPEPATIFWTRWRFSPTNTPPRFASVIDRNSVESEPERAVIDTSNPKTRVGVVGYRFYNYPRRQKRVRLRFYERDRLYRPQQVAELVVRNPSRAVDARDSDELQPWQAQELPIRVQQGSVEFVMQSIQSGRPAAPEFQDPYVFVAPSTTALFSVREKGVPSGAWTVRKLEAMGKAGNRFSLDQPLVGVVDDQLAVAFSNILWPDEPDWRFRVEFSRTKDYAPEDMVTLRSLPPIKIAHPFVTNVHVNIGGVSVTSLELKGSTQLVRAKARYRRTTDLTVRFQRGSDEIRLDLAGAVDQAGRPVPFGDRKDLWDGRYVAGLEIRPGVETVDLTFAVHRSFFVDFTVNPR